MVMAPLALNALRYVASFSLVFLLPLITLSAQYAHHLHHLGVAEGLSEDRYNQYVYQDRQGMVWISSLAGLNRFDGRHVKTYRSDPANPRSLYLDVSAQGRMAEDSSGNIWFAAANTLSRYNRETDDFSHFNFLDSNADTINELYYWSHVDTVNNLVWASAGRQLFTLDVKADSQRFVDSLLVSFKDKMYTNKTGENILLQPGIDSNYITIHRYTANGRLGPAKTYTLPFSGTIFDAALAEDGTAWVGTSTGVVGLQPEGQNAWAWLPLMTFQDGSLRDVVEIEITQSGELFLATKAGTYYRVNPSDSLLRLADNLVYKEHGKGLGITPYRLTLVPSGDFLISTKYDGVYYGNLDVVKCQSLHAPVGVTTNRVVDVATEEDGSLWALYEKDLVHFSDGQKTAFKLRLDGSENDEPTKVSIDRAGNVWVSTFNSLLLLREGAREVVTVSLPNIKNEHGFYEVYQLDSGDYLIGTNGTWPIWMDRDLKEVRTWVKRAEHLQFFETGEDGIILGGTLSDSLYLFWLQADQSTSVDTVISGLGLVNDAAYDGNRKGFWLATMKGLRFLSISNGEWRLEDDSKYPITVPISSLSRLSGGVLLLAVNGAIIQYFPERNEIKRFTRSDGVESQNFNFGAVAWSSDLGTVFGGDQGLTIVEPDNLNSKLPIREPCVSGILVNDEPIDIVSRRIAGGRIYLDLLSDQNNVTFMVSALDYADPETSMVRYRLVGGEASLSRSAGSDGAIAFNELPPGKYELWLSAVNSDGGVSAEKKMVLLEVAYPLHRTWGAYLLYAIIVAAIAFAFFWVRLQGIRKAEKERLGRAESDARAAKAEARAAETETSVLRLQMNPHFIFNSLNAVNAYILKGDKLKAHEYLVQFADLIRDILERSARPLTRMDLAIDLLRDYLNAERMRVGEKLTYAFEVDDELDTFTTFLPTMILQPFVENAIWHGISGLPDGGKITLRFLPDEKEGMLRVEIEDNGRGRAATATKGKRHRSMAMDITKRRLEILNTSSALTSLDPAPATAPRARYDIEDLKHPNGSAAGTRVKLYLPLDYPREYESSSD